MIVPFCNTEESETLKALGFNDPCFGYITSDGRFSMKLKITNAKLDKERKDYSNRFKGQLPEMYANPTCDQAFRWLEENHNVIISRRPTAGLDMERWIIYNKTDHSLIKNVRTDKEEINKKLFIEIFKFLSDVKESN